MSLLAKDVGSTSDAELMSSWSCEVSSGSAGGDGGRTEPPGELEHPSCGVGRHLRSLGSPENRIRMNLDGEGGAYLTSVVTIMQSEKTLLPCSSFAWFSALGVSPHKSPDRSTDRTRTHPRPPCAR